MHSIGNRIKGERNRLGYNQEEFAKFGGTGRRTQVNYEKGVRVPDAAYLAGIEKAGADINYIITGERLYDPELKALRGAARDQAILARIVQVEESLGMDFTESQVLALLGYARQQCPTVDALAAFVRAAFEVAEIELPKGDDADQTRGS